jgi:GMP reductase
MLAGHDECEGEIRYAEQNGETRPVGMNFYGMSSETAMTKYSGGVAPYRASKERRPRSPIGAGRGYLAGGHGRVRSMMTYIGAITLKEVSKRTTFVLVGRQDNTVFAN